MAREGGGDSEDDELRVELVSDDETNPLENEAGVVVIEEEAVVGADLVEEMTSFEEMSAAEGRLRHGDASEVYEVSPDATTAGSASPEEFLEDEDGGETRRVRAFQEFLTLLEPLRKQLDECRTLLETDQCLACLNHLARCLDVGLTAMPFQDTDHGVWFFNEGLPNLVTAVIEKENYTDGQIAAAVRCIRATISFGIDLIRLQIHCQPVANLMHRLLCAPGIPFYLRCSWGEEEFDDDDPIIEDGNRIPQVFWDMQRHFEEERGIEIVLERIEFGANPHLQYHDEDSAEIAQGVTMTLTEATQLLHQCYFVVQQAASGAVSPHTSPYRRGTNARSLMTFNAEEFLCRVARALTTIVEKMENGKFKREGKNTLQSLVRMVRDMMAPEASLDVASAAILAETKGRMVAVRHTHGSSSDVVDWWDVIVFRMTLGNRCFRSSSLDKRLFGLNEIKEVIRWVSPNDRYDEYLVETVKKAQLAVLQLLRNENILEYIFGPNVHLEILQRCNKILFFLIRIQHFTNEDIDTIWTPITSNQHRSIVHGVYTLLEQAVRSMEMPQLDHLFKTKLSAVPHNLMDPQLMSLITLYSHTVVNYAIRQIDFLYPRYGWPVQGDGGVDGRQVEMYKDFGFGPYMLLMDILDSESSVDAQVAMVASNMLNEFIMSGPSWIDKRTMIFDRCLLDLRTHKSVYFVLQLIMTIVGSEQRHRSQTSYVEFVQHLVQQEDLRAAYFDDLVWYKATSRETLERLGTESMTSNSGALEIDPNNAFLTGQQPHISEVKMRLEFLCYLSRWMYEHASAVLQAENRSKDGDRMEISEETSISRKEFIGTREQAMVLWDAFVSEPLTPEESAEAFASFLRLDQSQLFVNCIFEEKLPSLDFRKLTPNAFAFIRKCLLSVNLRSGSIVAESETTWEVRNPVQGESFIWNVALLCADEEVGRLAVRFLVDLHLNVLEHQLQEQSEELITACSAHLLATATVISDRNAETKETEGMQVSTDIPMPEVELKYMRCLLILQAFIDAFDAKHGAPEGVVRHGHLSRGSPISVKVQNMGVDGDKETYFVGVFEFDTIGILRTRIAKELDIAARGIRLLTAGKELQNELQTLKEAGIQSEQTIIVARRHTQEIGMQDGGDDSVGVSMAGIERRFDSPALILSQPKYFDKLFSMLELDDRHAAKIWDLLIQLPTNSFMMDTFRDLTEISDQPPPWRSWLEDQAPYKLLYSLEIIDHLLSSSTDGNGLPWKVKFLQRCGVEDLVRLLLSSSFAEDSMKKHSATLRALALLLKVLNVFDRSDIVEGDPSNQSTMIIRRLADIVLQQSYSQAVCAPINNSESLFIVKEAVKMIEKFYTDQIVPMAVSPSADVASGPHLLTFVREDDWLLKVLLDSASEKADIRRAIVEALFRIAVASIDSSSDLEPSSHTFNFILDTLLLYMSFTAAFPRLCEEYFDLLCHIVGKLSPTLFEERAALKRDVRKLLESVIEAINEHPISEISSSSDPDIVLGGLLRLATIILQQFPDLNNDEQLSRTLIDLTFTSCLFAVPDIDQVRSGRLPPKCKNDATRATAFELLAQLTEGNRESFTYLSGLLLEQIQSTGQSTVGMWNYSPKAAQKAGSGYVGLKNLGATCYMNSIMQQFYMIPSFRSGILSSSIGEGPLEDNLLYQLQVLLSYLQESEKKAFDTSAFCHACVDYEGNPTNVTVQMDVDEYFNLLFDRLENMMKGTPQMDTNVFQATVFRDHFGGQLLQQIKSKDCEHVSEREESFFAIQCEVKNKKGVEESLQLYVEGEMLDGDNKYYCATCAKHVDAVKRACIKSLPPTLIVHLKRFDFDMEAMRRVKINDYFEFPTHINMEPFTQEYLRSREHNQNDTIMSPTPGALYELSGILVHAGTADSGHYYSFIRERVPRDGNNGERRWFHFNDSTVEQFEPRNIPELAFGGFDKVSNWDDHQQKHVQRSVPKTYSAYMLLYDRVDNDPGLAKSNVPLDIFESIWNENRAFLRDRHVFDSGYRSALWKVLQSGAGSSVSAESGVDTVFRSIQLATSYFVTSLARSKDRSDLKQWMDFLSDMYSQRLDACDWFVNLLCTDKLILREVLFSCYVEEVREAFVNLLELVLKTLRAGDPQRYGIVADQHDVMTDENVDEEMKGIGFRLLDVLIGMLDDAHQNWRNFEHFFALFNTVAGLGREEKIYMIRHHITPRFVDLYLWEMSPFRTTNRSRLADRFNSPNYTHLIKTIHSLVTFCHIREFCSSTGEENENEPELVEEDGVIFLPRADEFCLYYDAQRTRSFPFFAKQLHDPQDPKATAQMLAHISRGNAIATDELNEFLGHELPTLPPEHFKANSEAISLIITADDEIVPDRVQKGVQTLIFVVRECTEHPTTVYECLNVFFIVASGAPYDHPRRKAIIERMDDWLGLLITSQYENIREGAYNLFTQLLLEPIRTLGTHDNDAESQMLPYLIEVTSKKYEHMMSQLSSMAESVRKYQMKSGASHRMVQYLRLMRECAKEVGIPEQFLENLPAIVKFFLVVRHFEVDRDPHMKELIIYMHDMSAETPAVLNAIAHQRALVEGLVVAKIGLDLTKDVMEFNAELLPKYYGLLTMLCRNFESCIAAWTNSSCFMWAIETLVFKVWKFEPVTSILVDLLAICAPHSADLRHKLLRYLVSVIPAADTEANFVKCVQIVTDTVDHTDWLAFCKMGHFSRLSRMFAATTNPEVRTLTLSALAAICRRYNFLSGNSSTHPFWGAVEEFNPTISSALKLLKFDCDSKLMTSAMEFLTQFTAIREQSRWRKGLAVQLLTSAEEWFAITQRETILSTDIPRYFGGENSPFGPLSDQLVLEHFPFIHFHPAMLSATSDFSTVNDTIIVPYFEWATSVGKACVLAADDSQNSALRLLTLCAVECLPMLSNPPIDALAQLSTSETSSAAVQSFVKADASIRHLLVALITDHRTRILSGDLSAAWRSLCKVASSHEDFPELESLKQDLEREAESEVSTLIDFLRPESDSETRTLTDIFTKLDQALAQRSLFLEDPVRISSTLRDRLAQLVLAFGVLQPGHTREPSEPPAPSTSSSSFPSSIGSDISPFGLSMPIAEDETVSELRAAIEKLSASDREQGKAVFAKIMREFRFGEDSSVKHVCGAGKIIALKDVAKQVVLGIPGARRSQNKSHEDHRPPINRSRLRPIRELPLHSPTSPPPPSESSELAAHLQDENDLFRSLSTELDEPPDVGEGDEEVACVGIDETIRHEELRLEREDRVRGEWDGLEWPKPEAIVWTQLGGRRNGEKIVKELVGRSSQRCESKQEKSKQKRKNCEINVHEKRIAHILMEEARREASSGQERHVGPESNVSGVHWKSWASVGSCADETAMRRVVGRNEGKPAGAKRCDRLEMTFQIVSPEEAERLVERKAGLRKTVETHSNATLLSASHEHLSKQSSGSSEQSEPPMQLSPGTTKSTSIPEQRVASLISQESAEPSSAVVGEDERPDRSTLGSAKSFKMATEVLKQTFYERKPEAIPYQHDSWKKRRETRKSIAPLALFNENGIDLPALLERRGLSRQSEATSEGGGYNNGPIEGQIRGSSKHEPLGSNQELRVMPEKKHRVETEKAAIRTELASRPNFGVLKSSPPVSIVLGAYPYPTRYETRYIDRDLLLQLREITYGPLEELHQRARTRIRKLIRGDPVASASPRKSETEIPYRALQRHYHPHVHVAPLKLGKMQLHFAPPTGDRGTIPSTRIAAVRLPHPDALPVLSHVPVAHHEASRRGSDPSARQNENLLSDSLLEDVGLAPRRVRMATSPAHTPTAVLPANNNTGVDGDLDLRVRLACLAQDEREMREHVERVLKKETQTRDQARRWAARKDDKTFMRLQKRVEDIAASGEGHRVHLESVSGDRSYTNTKPQRNECRIEARQTKALLLGLQLISVQTAGNSSRERTLPSVEASPWTFKAAQAYFACLKQNAADHAQCKEFSKAYLACRMDRGLMDKEDFSRIGYGDDENGKVAPNVELTLEEDVCPSDGGVTRKLPVDLVSVVGRVAPADANLANDKRDAGTGVRLSSTSYFPYGKVTARLRASRAGGTVAAFITMAQSSTASGVDHVAFGVEVRSVDSGIGCERVAIRRLRGLPRQADGVAEPSGKQPPPQWAGAAPDIQQGRSDLHVVTAEGCNVAAPRIESVGAFGLSST
ncbi:hypothetical protein BJ742DRAFT_771514 [Cladochytrium replicatum]|nr:hypothetical protein BJ742DRAFT_771514 [Cladochytrium replicatum]